MINTTYFLLFLGAFIFGSFASSLPLVSNVFSDNVVLQREPLRANIWGWTTAQQSVTVTLTGPLPQSKTTNANASGKWIIQLDATPAGGPYTVTVSSGASSQTLANVLFGDVIYCSGQSNMAFGLANLNNGTEEANLAPSYPNVRIFQIPTIAPPSPFDPLTPDLALNMSNSYSWKVPTPNLLLYSFSAVCWLTGRNLADSTNNAVPIGLVNNAWPGTPIELWLSPQVANNTECTVAASTLQTQIYNTMVYPLAPLQFIAMYWYQGEANLGRSYYGCLLGRMIIDYRQTFQNNFVFMAAQLAPRNNTYEAIQITREQQREGVERAGNGCAISNIDLGDLHDPSGAHPWTKGPLGYRGSLCIRKLFFNQDIVFSGPLPKCTVADTTANTLTVQFYQGTIGLGLQLRPATCPDLGVSKLLLCGHEWDIYDGSNWSPASYALSSDKQSVILSGVTLPADLSRVQYRYAWGGWPLSVLYNSADLPPPGFVLPYQPNCSVPEIYQGNTPSGANTPNAPSIYTPGQSPSTQTSPYDTSPNTSPNGSLVSSGHIIRTLISLTCFVFLISI